jgi:hypothetical protein
LLGRTGEDVVGSVSQSPNGVADVKIRLSNVQGTLTRVRVTAANGAGGIWESPPNSQGNWIVGIRPQADPTLVDLYFDFWQTNPSYTVALTFTGGHTQTIQTTQGPLPRAQMNRLSPP